MPFEAMGVMRIIERTRMGGWEWPTRGRSSYHGPRKIWPKRTNAS